MMSLEELLPALQELTHSDKLRAMKFLMQEIATEDSALLQPDMDYLDFALYDAHDTARGLLEMLDKEQDKRGE